jgi:hypothetical protein
MHPQTRTCHEFLVWRSRFEDSTDVAPEGASYAEIVASLNRDERATTTQPSPNAARHGSSGTGRSCGSSASTCGPFDIRAARPGTCSEQPAYDRTCQPCPVRWS